MPMVSLAGFFFFQAEDGIRDLIVTGVQTCALPISARAPSSTTCTRCSRSWASARAESSGRRSRARRTPLCPPNGVTWSVGGPFSLLQRGELFTEPSHRVQVQEGPPAHAGHADRGQLA